MKNYKNGAEKSGQEKGKNQNGKKGPEKTAEQQERNEKKEKEIPEDKRAERFLVLCSRLCCHIFDPRSFVTSTLFIKQG